MEIVVIWSDSAIVELQAIYDYFYYKANKKIADKVANDIVNKTLLLEQTLRMGQSEELLAHLHKEIRYLVSGYYKVVYLVDENIVTIATVFDCRRNPEKLGKKSV